VCSNWVLERADKKKKRGAVKDQFSITYLSHPFRGLFLRTSARIFYSSVLMTDLL